MSTLEISDTDKIAAIFNEWNREYSEDPDAFEMPLNENGEPVEDYGETCSETLIRIARKLGFIKAE